MTGNPGEQVVLVLSAEFVLKSSPVRRTLEQRLIDDLRFALRNVNIKNFTIDKTAGRIIVKGIHDPQLAAQTITRVFGVAYAIPATCINASMDSVLAAIQQIAMQALNSAQSFAIRCHGGHSTAGISSREVEKKAGSQILSLLADLGIRVDLDHPDLVISVDLVGEVAYVYTTRLQGPGGLPLSSHWKMLGILDSPLSLFAAYMMMRRGCLTQLLIPCSSAGMLFQKDRQIALARKLRRFVTRESYPGFILELDEKSQSISFIRRKAIDFAREHRFRGVVFSDVRGSIAFDVSVSRRATELGLPLFYPLIGFDDADLSRLGRLLDVDWRESLDVSAQFESTVDDSDLHTVTITEVLL